MPDRNARGQEIAVAMMDRAEAKLRAALSETDLTMPSPVKSASPREPIVFAPAKRAQPMSTTVQPDLFGEYDAQQERERLSQQPATCPRCGTTEPNGFLLSMNHGIDEPGKDTISGWPRGEHLVYGDRCTAQDLTRNHIWGAVVRGDDDDLARSVDRGRTLGLDTDAIIAEAQAEVEA